MIRRSRLYLMACAALAASSGIALAAPGTSGLDLVNATGHILTDLSIRRVGTQSWSPLPATPARPPVGAHAKTNFSDPDCAFDIKATLDDQRTVVWTGLNLCEVKSVTLNRNDAGVTWADYD